MTTAEVSMTSTATREIQYKQAINEALRQEMERDETVIIMGEEIAGGPGREHLGSSMPGEGLFEPPLD